MQIDINGNGIKQKSTVPKVRELGLSYLYYDLIYAVGHKKRDTLFWTIPHFLVGGFLHFLYQWKEELQNLQLYLNCVSTLPDKK